jgi:D-glycero-D-manno-heptose 1,7-bisphosphate phosphatase
MKVDPQRNPFTVFLDRDGTINREKDYLYRVEDFEFIRGVPQAIARLNRVGARVIVISNQSGIARGYYTLADVEKLHDHVQQELLRAGAHIDAFYYCPDHPQGSVQGFCKDTDDRKPGAGLFLRAIREHHLENDHRYVVGDKRIDLEAGHKVGCLGILVRTGYGEKEAQELQPHTDLCALITADLPEAVDWILSKEKE